MQSAYRRHHSTETSLTYLLDSIYHSADNGLATLLLSLDLSAAFDTIDHSILINRLISGFGITGPAIDWLKSYLLGRSFSVVHGSLSSASTPVQCGVPQGSVLGPILFTIYVSPIASIVSQFSVHQQQYADDTQLFVCLSPSTLSTSLLSLQQCTSALTAWFFHNGLALNPGKTEAICLGTRPRRQSLSSLTSVPFFDTNVTLSDKIKLLGVTLDNCLNLNHHVSNICSISYYHIRALRHIRPFLDLNTTKSLASAIVGSRLDYANAILYGLSSYNLNRLQRLQNSLARVVIHSTATTSSTSALRSLHWLPVQQRISFKLGTLVYRSLHGTCPQYISSLLHTYAPSRSLRSSSLNLLSQPRLNTSIASRGFRSCGPYMWNSLPQNVKTADSYSSFRSRLKTHLFEQAFVASDP